MKTKDFSNNILKPSPETISDKNVFQHFSSKVEKIKDKISNMENHVLRQNDILQNIRNNKIIAEEKFLIQALENLR